MIDSNITSRLRKLCFGHRVSPTPSKASSVSSQKSQTQLAKIDLYRPLSPSTREIRLLHILPEQPGSLLLGPDPISCILSHVSLDDKPTYHALSYTWGDDSLGQSFEDSDHVDQKGKVLISGFIFLDGQVVEVTPNLWVALWHLRRGANWFKSHPDSEVGEFGERLDNEKPAHFTYETPIWIDALCINQLDVLERNQQVQMMGSLYQNAQCVHSWTGLEVPDTKDFVDMVEENYASFHEATDTEIEIEFSKLLLDQNLESCWNTLSLVCNRAYWHRLWIVQEFLLGQQCSIHIGLRTINSDPLTWFVRQAKEVENKMTWEKGIVVFIAGEQGLPSFRTVQARRIYNGKAQITDILEVFVELNCSDPRDKIYSLLGLGGKKDYGIKVDYTLDADTVYYNSIRQILNQDRDLLLICNAERHSCQCTQSQHAHSSLPSWVPDFRCLRDTHRSLRGGMRYKPSGQEQAIITISSESNVLVCKGLHIGTMGQLLQKDSASVDVSDHHRNLVCFVSEASNALNPPGNPGLPSSHPLSDRFKNAYAALTGNRRFACITMDEATFVKYCTSSAPEDQPSNKKHVGRLFDLLDQEALFSTSLATPVPDVTEESLPQGPVFGKCYSFCQEGDIIVALYGFPGLLALRPDSEDAGRFEVMGDVCVPDFLDGQAVGMFAERDFELA